MSINVLINLKYKANSQLVRTRATSLVRACALARLLGILNITEENKDYLTGLNKAQLFKKSY